MATTETKVKYIFNAIAIASITMTDFARITRISRETLYRWRSGGAITDMLRLDFAYGNARRIEAACRSGKLPLTDKLKKEARVDRLRKIIAASNPDKVK